MLKAGEADLERYDYPAAKTNRILLQLHGGAYVQKLDDLYRITALTQGKLIGARTVYSLDYRVAPEAVYPAGAGRSAWPRTAGFWLPVPGRPTSSWSAIRRAEISRWNSLSR